jgi:pimeloyl-ACP methyl ester carboxylesterase
MNKLFILHGWTYQTATWGAVRTLLTERHIDYEFLLIPGLTDGTNPLWKLEDYVAWLEEKTAPYEKVILWGHSNGGRISLAFTAKHPEKVARLILEDSAGIPPRGMRKLKRDAFRKLAQILGRFIRFEHLRGVFRKAIRASDYAQATPEMRKTMSNLVAVDLGKILDRITCPALIVWGKGDETTPLMDGELIHRGIKGSRLVVLPDARHSPHITHPKELVDLVVKEIK